MERGSILIFSLLLLTVALSISLTLTGIFLPKLRAVSEATDATLALYAADSAAEHCLYEARKETNSGWNGRLSNGARFTIYQLPGDTVVPGNNCRNIGSQSFQFRATGAYRGVNRSLEIAQ